MSEQLNNLLSAYGELQKVNAHLTRQLDEMTIKYSNATKEYVRIITLERDKLAEKDAEIKELRTKIKIYQDYAASVGTDVDFASVVELREGLKRLQHNWHPNFEVRIDAGGPVPGYMRCVACGSWVECSTEEHKRPICKTDCWLNKLIGEGK